MKLKLFAALCSLALLTGCPAAGTTTQVRDSGNAPGMTDARMAAYDGPQARIAVARFENKTGTSRGWWDTSIGDGMADMLTTALFNSGRFIVLERQAVDDIISEQDLGASGRIRADTAAAIGQIEGAELLVVAAVTEFAENAGGSSGSIGGGRLGRVVGGLTGGSSSAHMAIDLRIIDTNTSRVLAATSVEGQAKDFKLGGALAGYTGRHALGGSLSSWQNTPREKALRQVIGAAVEEVVRRTPQQYYRHGGGGGGHSTSAAPTSGERVVITANSLNVRSGPSGDSSVVFSLASGDIVSVLSRAGDWIQIRDGGGRSGWVAAQFTLGVN